MKGSDMKSQIERLRELAEEVRQYELEQRETQRSLLRDKIGEKRYEDARLLAQDIRSKLK